MFYFICNTFDTFTCLKLKMYRMLMNFFGLKIGIEHIGYKAKKNLNKL